MRGGFRTRQFPQAASLDETLRTSLTRFSNLIATWRLPFQAASNRLNEGVADQIHHGGLPTPRPAHPSSQPPIMQSRPHFTKSIMQTRSSSAESISLVETRKGSEPDRFRFKLLSR